MEILNLYAPMKTKVVRGNNAPFMSKNLRKAIMVRSRLKNKFNKNPSDENRSLFKKQRNFIAFLRDELASKNKIIELIIKDKSSSISNQVSQKTNDVIILETKDVDPENKSIDRDNSEQINVESILKKVNVPTKNRYDVLADKETASIKKRKHRSTIILGDSMLKDIEPHKMRQAVGKSEKVYIKSFTGADTESMEHYIIPSKKYDNDLIILHFGTNDLRSDKQANDIAKGIINVAIDMKTKKNEVMISSIVTRQDNADLNKKGSEVNKHLISLCSVYNFNFIDKSCISQERHLNAGGLHLNLKGTYALANNLLNSIRL